MIENKEQSSIEKVIPKQFQHLFTNWEEYREWSIHNSKQELLKAFPNDRENRNEEIKTD